LPHVILDGHGTVVGRITLNEIVRGPTMLPLMCSQDGL
jgi:hypothetical protein